MIASIPLFLHLQDRSNYIQKGVVNLNLLVVQNSLDSQRNHMKAKAVKTIFSHLSLFSCETPYFVIFPYSFPTLLLLRRPVHPINVSSMKNCIQPAPNTQCLHFRVLAGMKIYISKEQMCQEINPIISAYTAHLGPALVATPEAYPALPPWGQVIAGI